MSGTPGPQPEREEFFQKLRERLVRLFMAKYCRSREQAEELAHRTIMIALEKPPVLLRDGDLFFWCIGIARRLVLGDFRRPEFAVELPDLADPRPFPADAAEDSVAVLEVALPRLKERCRKLIELQLQEKTSDEITHMLGITKGNFYVQVHRCHDRLKTIIEDIRERR